MRHYKRPTGLGFHWARRPVECDSGELVHVTIEKAGRGWLLTVCEWQASYTFRTLRAAKETVEEMVHSGAMAMERE